MALFDRAARAFRHGLWNPLMRSFRRFVWNRTTFNAILLSSPAILTAIGAFAMSRSVDAEIAALTQQRDKMTETSRQLDSFTRDVERFQLDRGSLLLVMAGQDSQAKLRYALDKLFRLNAQGSMRRVAGTLYPEEWKARMQPYEEIVQQDYGEPDIVQQLQAFESGMIADASRQLTALQEKINGVSAQIDAATAFKTTILSIGNSLMYILTIMIFFLKTNQT
ncbi:hypothetical protein [Bosea sp. 124]|uniref:hypothetical protein n=1 Tax=Bosea sp. 124 TaxID=2135642 RepID=UPI000D48E30A|nr:hypothetical protein [Bosea sp. 124]PTM41388.1 hypothetical protein C8D03_2931 [Bosea sp. 124]